MARLDVLLKKKKVIVSRSMAEWESAPDVETILTKRASCHIDDKGGARQIHGENWSIVSDSGPALGGTGQNPGAVDLLCGALASCLTHMYFINAAMMDIPLDNLSVDVAVQLDGKDAASGLFSRTPIMFKHIEYSVHIESPASDDMIESLHRAADTSCPLKNALIYPTAVKRVDAEGWS